MGIIMKRENRLANLDIQSKRKIKMEKNKNIHTEAIKMYMEGLLNIR